MKAGKRYYLCQFVGIVLFVIWTFGSSYSSDESYDYFVKIVWNIFNFIVLVVIISHFVIRDKLKKCAGNINFIFYLRLVLSASLLAVVSHLIMDFVFVSCLDLDLAKNSEFIVEDSLVIQLFKGVIVYGVVFSLWLLLYLGLTSNRDKNHLAQQLTEQRLTSLMNQINPHFLFNSLNTIRGMIFEDQEKAADLVTQLSSLFRYNLASDSKGVTSLTKELAVCQQYLAIEHIRLGKRLQVDLLMSPSSMSVNIPTMALLTLVENAIKHGIAKLKTGGTLTIKSEFKKNKVIITVINPYQADLVVSGTQVGLNNIKQRIALMYGSQGTLTQEETNGIFQVQLIFPCEVLTHD